MTIDGKIRRWSRCHLAKRVALQHITLYDFYNSVSKLFYSVYTSWILCDYLLQAFKVKLWNSLRLEVLLLWPFYLPWELSAPTLRAGARWSWGIIKLIPDWMNFGGIGGRPKILKSFWLCVEIQGFGEEILISCGYRNLPHLVFIMISIISYWTVHMITHTHTRTYYAVYIIYLLQTQKIQLTSTHFYLLLYPPMMTTAARWRVIWGT